MADGFCRGRAIWSAKLFWPREFRPRPSVVSRIDRHGRSVPIQNFGRSRPSFPVRACRANGFCRAIDESGRARAIPSRLDRNGRPDENCSAKILLRVRGQCFGADCVFTPFSPSILS
ncbi:unnamed protein product [Microthlaspi erraticum]|uniref:Uncharacterized protein n=1 Tax=Microthlaspi erraticum TaxID=1685480 RepID=A0A6D2HFR1_9BRAS|nr:unnamed protein product [Microthlaspi erraticum]